MTISAGRLAKLKVLPVGVGVLALLLPFLRADSTSDSAMALVGLALLFAVIDAYPAVIPFGRSSYSIAASEIPLVMGLALLSPTSVLVARLLGSGVVKLIRHRRDLVKWVLNLSIHTSETAIVLWIVVVFDTRDLTRPGTWPVLFLALLAKEVYTTSLITLLLHWHGELPRRRDVLGNSAIALVGCFVNGCLGLITLVMWTKAPSALLPLGIVVGILLLAYRSYLGLRDRYFRVSRLYEFSKVLSASTQTTSGVAAVASKTRQVLSAQRVQIVVGVENASQMLRITASDDGSTDTQYLDTDEWRASPDALRPPDHLIATPDRLFAPLRSDAMVLGAIEVRDRLGGRPFDADDRIVFETLVSTAAAWFENGKLIEQLQKEIAEREHQAFHDALTDLPNRRLFQARSEAAIANAIQEGATGAVLLMDLDSFKEVNDALGHHTGDALLKEIAVRIESALPQGASLARLGGDEFAVLVPRVIDVGDASRIARQVLSAIREPITAEGVLLSVDASLGVALFPRDASQASTALQKADVAMYSAKEAKTGVEFYSPDRDVSSARRLALLGELRKAFENDQLFIHVQPKVTLSDGRIRSVEALIRWRHPTSGLIMPDDFIPVAEQTGVINELTNHVLELGVVQLERWKADGLELSMAVNISARNLLDSRIVEHLQRLLDSHQVSPSSLTLELTESAIMGDRSRCIEVLNQLARLGVHVAVDDFGTGQSSLAYLRELPVNELKIDKRFVRNMLSDHGDDAIVRTIIDLGRHLGLTVVAEGVEDQATFEMLRSYGCDSIQGYYVSRPIPPPQFVEWLNDVGDRFGPPAPLASVRRHPANSGRLKARGGSAVR